jgi:hypothetical protein
MRKMAVLGAGMLLGGFVTALALAAASKTVSAQDSPQDPVKLAPEMYKVVLENDQVRESSNTAWARAKKSLCIRTLHRQWFISSLMQS